MTLAQYLRVLREQWFVVLLLVVLTTAGAAAYTFRQTPQYTAETQLFISVSGGRGDLSELTQGGTFTQQRVKSYADIVSSPVVAQAVIDKLGLPYTPAQLVPRVTASNPLDTVLLDISVTDTDPELAARIANGIAQEFPRFVADLETPNDQALSPVKVSITREAAVPQAPVSPRVPLNLALGLLVGLGLGVGAAVLRDSLDRTIGGRNDAADLAGAPVLGAVVDDPGAKKQQLITGDAFSPRAEAYRAMRTNLRFLSVDHKVRSFVVTGSVAHEGKTTTAANVAIAIAAAGEPVVLIDADLRRPSIANAFGLPGGAGLTNVLLGDTPVEHVLQDWRPGLPLSILASGPQPPNPSELIGSSALADLVEHLTSQGTTVIFDSPPLLPVTDAAVLARITDGALVVTRVASTRRDQLETAISALRTAGAPVLGIVLNRTPKRGRGSDYTSRETYTYAPQRDAASVRTGPHPGPQTASQGQPDPRASIRLPEEASPLQRPRSRR